MLNQATSGRFVLLVALTAAATSGVGACAQEESVASEEDGPKVDDIVAERQLNGSDMPEKTISLTLDDGPGARTGELADFLKEKGIRGTFFINGMNASKYKDGIDKIVTNGHILANHTQHHKQLTKLNSAALISEVQQTDAIIAAAQPDGPFILRAPFGAWNATVAKGINASPMTKYVGSVFWDEGGDLTDHSAADWACWGKAAVSVQRCGELYLKEIRTKKRGIILMHDIHSQTIDMIKVIVPVLQAEGYKFVGVDEAPSVRRAIASAKGVSAAPGPETEGERP